MPKLASCQALPSPKDKITSEVISWINKSMEQTIYLYKKTHRKTGLKYLGKTVQDPFEYKGSGKKWKDHLSKHGDDIETEILFESTSNDEIREKGIYYSDLWNVIENPEWANLVREEGSGGRNPASLTEEANSKRSATLKGRTVSEEHRRKLSEANKGKNWLTDEQRRKSALKASAKLKGRTLSEEHKQRIGEAHKGKVVSKDACDKMKAAWSADRRAAQSERTRLQNASRPIITCPHCGKVGTNPGNMNRYHFDNCKLRRN